MMQTMRIFRLSWVPFATLAAATLAASCSGSSAPPASAYIKSTLGTNPENVMSTQSCTIQEPGDPFFTIGVLNGSEPSPVPTGTSVAGADVTVDCSVHSMGGNSYSVNLEVTDGMSGGINVFGTVADSPGVAQPGLQASFTSVTAGTGISYATVGMNTCSFTLSTQGNPPITAGRIWGTLTCPLLVDASDSGATCYGTVDLLFQNCQE